MAKPKPHAKKMIYISPQKAALPTLICLILTILCFFKFFQLAFTGSEEVLKMVIYVVIGFLAFIPLIILVTFAYTNKPLVIVAEDFIILDSATGDRARVDFKDIKGAEVVDLPILGQITMTFLTIDMKSLDRYGEVISQRREKFYRKHQEQLKSPFFINLSLMNKKDQDYLLHLFHLK